MENKKLLYIIIAGILAVIGLCVLIVGLVDGAWPWGSGKPGSDYTGMNPAGEETSETTTQDATGDATDGTGDPTESTGGSGRPGNNNVVDSDLNIDLEVENNGDFGAIDFDDLLPDDEDDDDNSDNNNNNNSDNNNDNNSDDNDNNNNNGNNDNSDNNDNNDNNDESETPTTPGGTTPTTPNGDTPAPSEPGDLYLPFD